MRIWNLDICWGDKKTPNPAAAGPNAELKPEEIVAQFRVPQDDPRFMSILQVVASVEREMIEESRGFADAGDATRCVNATGAHKACEIIRARFVRLREEAVKGREQKTPNA